MHTFAPQHIPNPIFVWIYIYLNILNWIVECGDNSISAQKPCQFPSNLYNLYNWTGKRFLFFFFFFFHSRYLMILLVYYNECVHTNIHRTHIRTQFV